MTPVREAVTLPGLFLTVLLLGGLRIGSATALVPPTPYFLVLGVLIVHVVIRSGALAPEKLMAPSRSEIANLNGVAVLITLWLAAAQLLAVLTPDSGLPRIAFSVFFLVLLLSTSAAAPDRQRLLRSLAVTFGAAFVLKFVALHALSVPGDGVVKRLMVAVLDSVTVGALVQEALHPVTAYLVLCALGLFLVGVTLLPRRDPASPPGPAARELPPIILPAP